MILRLGLRLGLDLIFSLWLRWELKWLGYDWIDLQRLGKRMLRRIKGNTRLLLLLMLILVMKMGLLLDRD